MTIASQNESDGECVLSEAAREALPKHVAVIMDGNGRWAKSRGFPRVEGHRNGIESVRSLVRAAADLGVGYLTLYAFSNENWNRPKAEVETLMRFLSHYMKKEVGELMANNVRLEVMGHLHRLPEKVREEIRSTQEQLAANDGLTLIMALSYGSRAEIVDAVKAISRRVKEGELSVEDIDESTLSNHLYTRSWPDPDLLIRTSGEMRISNFLLWQISYAEFVVTPTLWPDFRKPQFYAALEEYASRHRRFGGL